MADTMTVEDLKPILMEHRDGISALIDEKVKDQSTKADEEIAKLKVALVEANKGITALEEAQKRGKSFGLPGCDEEKETFSWQKYFKAQYLAVANGKGSAPLVSDPWKAADAEFEKEVCSQYFEKRAADLSSQMRVEATNKAYGSDDGSSGGFLVPPEWSNEVIDLVIAQMPIFTMPGVKQLRGLHGDLYVPTQASRNTGYHIGETEAPTESTGSFGGVWLRPKKVGGFTKQSNRLLYQSRGVSDSLIKDLLASAVRLEWHRGLLNGKGSDSEAKGLTRYSGMTTTSDGTNTMQGSAGNWRFRIDDTVKMMQGLANADELRDTNTYGFIMHPVVMFGMARERVLQYAGQANNVAQPVLGTNVFLTKEKLKEVIGYPIAHTTQMPKTGTLTDVYFGDWSLFWTAQFRDPIFRVSDQASDGSTGSAFLQDQLYMVMFVEYDCQLMREAAFAKFANAETNESNW